MYETKYFVLHNPDKKGYYCNRGVKSYWDLNILKADIFKTFEEAEEAARWFSEKITVKMVTVQMKK